MFSAQNVIRDKTRELSKYKTPPEPAQIEKLFPDGLSMNSEKYSPLTACYKDKHLLTVVHNF